jgi:hydrogenase maturation protein HypF
VCNRAGYEAQAAAELEAAARSARDGERSYVFAVSTDGCLPWPLDAAPVIAAAAADVLAGVPAPVIAVRFHRAVVSAVADVAERVRAVAGIGEVTLSGGVFVNVLLSAWCAQELAARGFTVLRHHRVPPTDAGLALGQVAVAARQGEGERCA